MADMDENEAEPTANAKAESGPPNATGGTRARSETPYPYFGLGRGIEVVEAVRKAGGNEALSVDVMRELGVAKTTDRLWAYGIPAAQYFGLIERVGRGDEGRIKLTDLAMRIVLPGSPDEGRAAKVAACKTPELYAKLIERFAGHPVPSRDGLKNILHRDFKIVESTAAIAADAFTESLKTAELVTSENVILGADSGRPVPAPEKTSENPAPNPQKEEAPPGMQTLHVPADFIIYKCKLGKGRVIDVPLPREFTKAEVDRLHAFLQTQVDEDI